MDRDDSLAKLIADALSDDRRIDWPSASIGIDVRDGTAILQGTVGRLADKRYAVQTAASVRGVTAIEDRLLVKSRHGAVATDVSRAVLDLLEQDPYVDASRIQVSAKGGVVHLEGTAGSLVEKRVAGVCAWWVPGVEDVVNDIQVVPPESDGADQITEACEVVLEKDPLVDATEVLVQTRDHTVTLLGAVNSEEERNAAEDDCWYVWGVREVINRIAVVPTTKPV